jgi:hypothetical protein
MMRSLILRAGALSAALALVALLSMSPEAFAQKGQGWGTVKGTILYDAKAKIPENKEATISQDKQFCTSKGKIFQDEWVVDAKSRGVKWVLVWLADASDTKGAKTEWPAKLIHPDLAKAPATLELDQPVCTFAPRMVGIRAETKLIYKNSAKVGHNVRIEGGDLGPVVNQLIPPGKQLDVGAIKARPLPLSYSCTIHPWMKGWIGAFKHPYFAVTNEKGEFEIKNAPAGKYRLMVWHEGYGFVQQNKNNRGIVINIEDKKTTEVKPIEIKKED